MSGNLNNVFRAAVSVLLLSLAQPLPASAFAQDQPAYNSGPDYVVQVFDGRFMSGTGTVVTSRHVVTAKHVIRRGTDIRVNSNGVWHTTRVVAVTDKPDGPALLELSAPLSVVGIAIAPDLPAVGSTVTIQGLGVPGRAGGFRSVSGSIVGSTDTVRPGMDLRVNVVNARSRPGDSGGPVIDSRGYLLGLVLARGSNDEETEVCMWKDLRAVVGPVLDPIRETRRTVKLASSRPMITEDAPVVTVWTTFGCVSCEVIKDDVADGVYADLPVRWDFRIVPPELYASIPRVPQVDFEGRSLVNPGRESMRNLIASGLRELAAREFVPAPLPDPQPDPIGVPVPIRSAALSAPAAGSMSGTTSAMPVGQTFQADDVAAVDLTDQQLADLAAVRLVLCWPVETVRGEDAPRDNSRVVTFLRGPLDRVVASASDGRLRLEVVSEYETPTRYRAVADSIGIDGDDPHLAVVVGKVADVGWVKGILLRKVESKITEVLEDQSSLRSVQLDPIFQRERPAVYAAVSDALATVEPVRARRASAAGLTIEADGADTAEAAEDEQAGGIVGFVLGLLSMMKVVRSIRGTWHMAKENLLGETDAELAEAEPTPDRGFDLNFSESDQSAKSAG